MDMMNVDLKEIGRYLTVTGKKGGMVLSILGRLSKQVEAVLNNEVGAEILRDDINRMEFLLVKIYREEVNPMELAEFRYLRDVRMPTIIGKLKQYLELIKEVKKDALQAV
jgi:hypothetical protein